MTSFVIPISELRSRFSVMGSEAGYSETVDGDHSDFGMAYGVYRR